jgi:hypothetical protein
MDIFVREKIPSVPQWTAGEIPACGDRHPAIPGSSPTASAGVVV